MPHTTCMGHWNFGSGEEDFKVFIIYRHGRYPGNVAMPPDNVSTLTLTGIRARSIQGHHLKAHMSLAF